MSVFRILLLSGTGNASRIKLSPGLLQFTSKGGTKTLSIECGGQWRLSLSAPETGGGKENTVNYL